MAIGDNTPKLSTSENGYCQLVLQQRDKTVSKRVAEKKVAKFEKNISRRGVGPISSNKALEPAHILLILFAVLVVASFLFQVVRMAMNGGIPE